MRKVSSWGLALALVAVTPPGARAEASAGAETLEARVDRYLEPYLKVGHLSATVLIARGDEVVYHRSFGLADREHAVRNTPRTRSCGDMVLREGAGAAVTAPPGRRNPSSRFQSRLTGGLLKGSA